MIDSSRDYVTLFSATLIKKKSYTTILKVHFKNTILLLSYLTALPVIKKEKKKKSHSTPASGLSSCTPAYTEVVFRGITAWAWTRCDWKCVAGFKFRFKTFVRENKLHAQTALFADWGNYIGRNPVAESLKSLLIFIIWIGLSWKLMWSRC